MIPVASWRTGYLKAGALIQIVAVVCIVGAVVSPGRFSARHLLVLLPWLGWLGLATVLLLRPSKLVLVVDCVVLVCLSAALLNLAGWRLRAIWDGVWDDCPPLFIIYSLTNVMLLASSVSALVLVGLSVRSSESGADERQEPVQQ